MQLTNNDMKDSSQSFTIGGEMMAAVIFPVLAALAILGSFLISDVTAVSAKESPEMTRIAADIDESYFTADTNDRLAQGKIEARSDNPANDDEEDETEEVTDESNQCGNLYLEDHLRIDFSNDNEEVLRLQSFLKTYENYDYVNLSGTFDAATLRAVKAFQSRYADDILTPWGYEADEATGYVYITTKQKINEIYCDEQFMLTREEQAEIREYRQQLNAWRAQGASFETPQYLATYYGYGGSEGTVTDSDNMTIDDDTTDTSGGITVTETPDDDTATSATSTDDDGRNFFQRLFGIGGDDDTATSTATTSTTTEDVDGSDEEVSTTTDDEDMATTATSTATTSGLDNVAAGVYNGVNGIINFLLSPTFLLVVLVVLILLLIATLIETDEGEDGDVDDSDDEDMVVNNDESTTEDVADTDEAWDEYAEAEETDETDEESVDDKSN